MKNDRNEIKFLGKVRKSDKWFGEMYFITFSFFIEKVSYTMTKEIDFIEKLKRNNRTSH